jgi:hypothetical protein
VVAATGVSFLNRWAAGAMRGNLATATACLLGAGRRRVNATPLLYVRTHASSARTMFSRGVKVRRLPADFKSFAHVVGIRIDPKPCSRATCPQMPRSWP